jgi:FKBP-type peptidyl-prolyl cis-trans isomerase SlyD
MVTVLGVQGGGHRQVTVEKVGSSVVDVDLNHPLAGKMLTFDVEIVDVRDATPEELSHGHAHGAFGHDHEH